MLILVSGARLPRGLHVREHLQGADPDPGAAEGPGHEPPVLAIVYTALLLEINIALWNTPQTRGTFTLCCKVNIVLGTRGEITFCVSSSC